MSSVLTLAKKVIHLKEKMFLHRKINKTMREQTQSLFPHYLVLFNRSSKQPLMLFVHGVYFQLPGKSLNVPHR